MINRRYLIKKKIGQGRSAVYLCEDLEHERKKIALKILSHSSSTEEQKIFKDEFEIIQNLNHPNIIRAFERGTVVEITERAEEQILLNSKYLATEYFDGSELLKYEIKDELILKNIITQICSALFYLHQSNYIYYDLKPENILVKEIQGKPFIKLIDFGFAKSRTDENRNVIGTAEYLAPEILKKEPHDHRVDLYSLGILLFRLIYGKFPFQSQVQLEIYKEHIEKEFHFPEVTYSTELINAVKKLLNKNPDERYFTSVQVLHDLNIPITEELYRNWIPVKIFSDRVDILNIVNRYVTAPSSGEIVTIRGFEKSGKSAVIRELYSRLDNSVLFENDRAKSGVQLIKSFMNKLIFNEVIFDKIPADTIELVNKIFTDQSLNIVNDLRLVVNKVTKLDKLVLLMDDFNLYDSFSLEVFKEIFPVLQVNGCNVILTEKSDQDYVTNFINNLIELNLTSFTTVQTNELIEKTYAEFFPTDRVKKMVAQYADFLPGNIFDFLCHIVLLKIIRFEYDGVKVLSDEKSDQILRNLFQEIYRIRYKSLADEEIRIAELLSSFDIVPERKNLRRLTNLSEENFIKTLEELQRKHVFHSQTQSGLVFTSDGLKNFIYSQIADKKTHHEKLAKTIRQKIPQFSKVELARHYAICEKFDDSYSLLLSEAEEAEKISALKYARTTFEKLLALPVKSEKRFNVKLRLSSLYDVLNDFQQTYKINSALLQENLSNELRNDLLMLQGNALIRIGEIEEGMEILKSLLPITSDDAKKIKLMLNIAGAELDINNYDAASQICLDIIGMPIASHENKGDAYNLLGLKEFYKNNDLDSALTNFQLCLSEYEAAESIHRIAAIEINIGNIFNIRADYDNVEKHWNRSLEITQSTGNLYQQGKVSLNFGGFYFHKLNFDAAIENYKKAEIIFNSLGDQYDRGLSETNLGEAYLFMCQYQNAVEYLESAREVFHKIQNFLEEAEALFLLGKLFFKIGHYKKLSEIIISLQKILESNITSTGIECNLNQLKLFHQFALNGEVDINSIKQIASEYLGQEERIKFFDAFTLIINYLLSKDEFEKVYEILDDKNFIDVCDSNVYLKAERYFLIGKTASKNSELTPESPLHYLQKALNLVSELNVTELTWKILFEISTHYFNRGNKIKAKEFASYGQSLIKYLAECFKDEVVMDLYLNSAERKNAQEKFTEIINSN